MLTHTRKLSVAVCTHNRGHLLEPLVDELVKQELDEPFEILLVDNSTNQLDTNAADRLASIPQVRVIHSSPPGLSRARNKAIENCRTEVIAFLDDDALPLWGWAQSILAPFVESEVGFVAGPIIPVWPEGGRPDWVPDQFVGCLSVLEMGNADRKLEVHEYAYGANMAFRLNALQAVGGFDAALGRSGSTSLLSEEEVDVQDKLRKHGVVGYYAAKARVHHTVDRERLARHWFLSRMAWQGVSVALKNSQSDQNYLLALFQQAAKECGISELPGFFLNESDPVAFGKRLTLVQHLFAYLLNAKSFTDISSDSFKARTKEVQTATVHEEEDEYHPSAPVPSDTKYLFFDGRPGHHYLFELYGEIPNSQFVIAEMNQWSDQKGRDIGILERSVLSTVDAIVMLTLDPYVFGPNFPYAYEMIKRQSKRRRVYGFLHRLPESPQNIEHLTRLAPHISLIMFDETLVGLVRELVRSQNVYYLPHHAVLNHYLVDKNLARARRQLPGKKIIISMLGELREGKGIERLFDALPHLTSVVKQEVLFLIVGKAKHLDPDEIRSNFLREGVQARVISSKEGNSYKLVPTPELGDYVSASDIGLLLYEKSQKLCMSGMLANYLMCGIPLIASKDSIVGQNVEKYELGWVTDVSNPADLAESISNAVRLKLDDATLNDNVSTSKHEIHASTVLKELQTILQHP